MLSVRSRFDPGVRETLWLRMSDGMSRSPRCSGGGRGATGDAGLRAWWGAQILSSDLDPRDPFPLCLAKVAFRLGLSILNKTWEQDGSFTRRNSGVRQGLINVNKSL